MRDSATPSLAPFFLALLVAVVGFGYTSLEAIDYHDTYCPGSVVTTTAEYEYLTNDSFTGVVMLPSSYNDQAVTVRNRDGEERIISTKFLEPVEWST